MDTPDSNFAISNNSSRMGDDLRYPFVFTATATEYFRIWIVNLALTVLTIGIYSPWAKVRKKRYFYGHTQIDGEGFEYRANPIAILKGRIIAVIAACLFYGAGKISLQLQLALIVAGIFIAPWLIVRTMAFNAYCSAYRNVRFQFRGTYGQCLSLIVRYGLLVIFTLGIGYPYLKRRLVQFAAENHYYGATQFAVDDLKKSFMSIYSRAIGLGILLGIISGVITFLIATGLRGSVPGTIVFVISKIPAYIAYLAVFSYLRTRIANATWNSIAIGAVHFECSMRVLDVFWLYITNICAILLSLGLATPWAVVRTMRYRSKHMCLLSSDSLSHFEAAESAQVSATGEEVGEMFDIGIGL